MTAPGRRTDVPVEPEAARAALDRVLASETFAHTDRLSRFLRFTVEQTLDGQAEHLKEYVLGVEVFDRPGTFDPRIDSIVRVEARRLRSKLAEYYDAEGASDPVVIRLRKGSYVPQFEPGNGGHPLSTAQFESAPSSSPRGPVSRSGRLAGGALALGVLVLAALGAWLVANRRATPAAPQTSVAVLPFAHFSTDSAQQAIADRVTDGIISELARVPALAVRSRTSIMRYRDPRRPLREIARELDADVVMEGRVSFAGNQVRLEARLVSARSDSKIWVDDFVGSADDLPALERQVARAAAAALANRRR
jgi:TolB-like protein